MPDPESSDDVPEGPAFSNGTEWSIWQAHYCGGCVRDLNEDCPHILTALMGAIPEPWRPHPEHRWHCTVFSADPDDAPTAPMSVGQQDLFPEFNREESS